ncbi:hypothetical protein PSTG_18174, partial [Puccinia striiformis f. sp. tritici PST-78]
MVCSKYAHSDCLGLSGRVTDIILNDPGVFWLCFSCRERRLNFVDLAGATRAAFNALRTDFNQLYRSFEEHNKCIGDVPISMFGRDTRDISTNTDEPASVASNVCESNMYQNSSTAKESDSLLPAPSAPATMMTRKKKAKKSSPLSSE